MFPGPMLLSIYIVWYLCCPVLMFPSLYNMFPGPMFLYLCFPVSILPCSYVTWYLCCLIPMFQGPMLLSIYVFWYLCYQTPMFPGTYSPVYFPAGLCLMQKQGCKKMHCLQCKIYPFLSSKFPISHQMHLIGKVHGHGQLDQEINTEPIATLGHNWTSCNGTSNAFKLKKHEKRNSYDK